MYKHMYTAYVMYLAVILY